MFWDDKYGTRGLSLDVSGSSNSSFEHPSFLWEPITGSCLEHAGLRQNESSDCCGFYEHQQLLLPWCELEVSCSCFFFTLRCFIAPKDRQKERKKTQWTDGYAKCQLAILNGRSVAVLWQLHKQRGDRGYSTASPSEIDGTSTFSHSCNQKIESLSHFLPDLCLQHQFDLTVPDDLLLC